MKHRSLRAGDSRRGGLKGTTMLDTDSQGREYTRGLRSRLGGHQCPTDMHAAKGYADAHAAILRGRNIAWSVGANEPVDIAAEFERMDDAEAGAAKVRDAFRE